MRGGGFGRSGCARAYPGFYVCVYDGVWEGWRDGGETVLLL
jgi:hypothetical protein